MRGIKGKGFTNGLVFIGFGNKVRSLRMEKKLTIEQFANEHNLNVTQLSRIERGEFNVTISYIFLLAKLLDVKPSELLDFGV